MVDIVAGQSTPIVVPKEEVKEVQAPAVVV